MDSFRDTIEINTDQTEEILDVTGKVQSILSNSGVDDGMVSVFPLHTSSAVFINDSDRNLLRDVEDVLRDLVPETKQYEHNKSDPKQNATAHIKSILTGHHVTIPVTDGTFDFGRFHTIYYAEFDGGRAKEILVKIIGSQ